MKRRVLIIVDSDPRTSPRPAEAVRIAAGVGVWEKAEITLYLRAAAVLALGEFADELVDGDNFAHYLPVVTAGQRPVLVQRKAAQLKELGMTSVKFEGIDDHQLAVLSGASDATIRF